jgi:hypothetical protein
MFMVKINSYTLLFLISIALAIRVLFVFVIPYGQIVKYKLEGLNDEPSHFNYVRYLSIHRQFPIQKSSVQEKDAFIKNEFEYYQPPLYYTICALITAPFSNSNALLISRFVSLIFGLITTFLIYRIILLSGYSQKVGLFAATTSLFLLSPAYFSSLCSNDSLSWLFPIAFLYFYLKLDKIKYGLKELFLFTSIIALSLLTKSSNTILVIVAICLSIYEFFKKDYGKASLLIKASIFGILVASPWYIRNYLIYNSFFALQTGFGPVHPKTLSNGFHLVTMLKAAIESMWFPMQHLPSNKFRFVLNMTGLCIVIFYTYTYFFWMLKTKNKRLVICINLLLLISVAAYIDLNYKWSNPEGRYLFSALFPIIFIFSVPLNEMFSTKKQIFYYFPLLFLCLFPYCYFFLV